MPENDHDLHHFMKNVTDEIEREYTRIQKSVKDDPGSAGDQGEENWAEILKLWLPSYYHVVTKGRIIDHDGNLSPQVDVIVLHPSYPKQLLNIKNYIAGGVVAAFECKITFRLKHLEKSIKTSKIIKKFEQKYGTPFRELNSSILYGILAHSNEIRNKKQSPLKIIQNKIVSEDRNIINHPREMIDLICIADLATWVAHKMPWIGPQNTPDWNDGLTMIYGKNGSAISGYLCVSKDGPKIKNKFNPTPIGAFFQFLITRLAWDDTQSRRLAKYFMSVSLLGQGTGNIRLWGLDIFSKSVGESIKNGKLGSKELWDEWSLNYPLL